MRSKLLAPKSSRVSLLNLIVTRPIHRGFDRLNSLMSNNPKEIAKMLVKRKGGPKGSLLVNVSVCQYSLIDRMPKQSGQ